MNLVKNVLYPLTISGRKFIYGSHIVTAMNSKESLDNEIRLEGVESFKILQQVEFKRIQFGKPVDKRMRLRLKYEMYYVEAAQLDGNKTRMWIYKGHAEYLLGD